MRNDYSRSRWCVAFLDDWISGRLDVGEFWGEGGGGGQPVRKRISLGVRYRIFSPRNRC